MRVERFEDGTAICGDSTSVELLNAYTSLVGDGFRVPLIISDPPYGRVLSESWDRVSGSDEQFVDWMLAWTRMWSLCLEPRGAFYVWGGVGRVGFRPFFKYLSRAEVPGEFELANLITWSKKRAYGVQNNYLFTREECAYFVKGDAKKPLKFHVPHLASSRGYPGYNKKYPAKSDKHRRTNVWTDVTEVMRGKVHPAQKAQRVIEVPIEVHTDPGDTVVDPFAGSGTTAFACRKLGRRFVVVEKDESAFDEMVSRLRGLKSAAAAEYGVSHGDEPSSRTEPGVLDAAADLLPRAQLVCLEQGAAAARADAQEVSQALGVQEDCSDGQAVGDCDEAG